jgi:membrane protein
VRERIVSFALVLAIGFLLLVSLAINTWISIVGRVSSSAFPGGEAIWHGFSFLVSMAIAAGLFAAIYKVMPDVRLGWRDAFVGGAFTAALFTTGKLLVGTYLGKASIGSSYGAASSIVLLIVWVYYSSQVFFFGAECTKVFTDRYGLQSQVHQGVVTPTASSNPATSEPQSKSHINKAPPQSCVRNR